MNIGDGMRLCLFGGTSEGRLLAEFMASMHIEADVWVATEYGESLIKDLSGIHVTSCRLDEAEMESMFSSGNYSAVIDATHPFAREVSENIRRASSAAKTELIRVVRHANHHENCTYFDSASQCAEFLDKKDGKVLLTTGSKDLDVFASVCNFKDRMFPRVLPAVDSLVRCVALGYKSSNVICMQGPFTREMNAAMLRQTGASFMVTKETAGSGGYDEKVVACRDAEAECLIIKMPEETGLTLEEAKEFILKICM